ncbi:MAG: thioredoxin domain-containing protein, partial [Chloroflexi bacterium]|nr:thioredoxin domain-containing protein [Chloroflexota bacterium]
VMNEHFICIKVDREERPDIDQIYMEAVQAMTGGGWPLNCFALPDGRPFYGGTYYPRDQWISLCETVAREYRTNRQKIKEYARQLDQHISSPYPFLVEPADLAADGQKLASMVNEWKTTNDPDHGGENRAPKFPMPANLEFQLQYGHLFDDDAAVEHVLLTLRRMAQGGIYDQIGGGFARYSTDKKWKVPHFEKMLYDNAQLVSLYTHAFQLTRDEEFKFVVEETIEFVLRELTAPEGIFSSSLDADSEGEEGRYYTWEMPELEQILGDLLPIAREYFNFNSDGLWENRRYIPLRQGFIESVADRLDIPVDERRDKIRKIEDLVFSARQKRVRPALDDKSLASWNGLMIKAMAEAAVVFQNKDYLTKAEKAAGFILENFQMKDGGLYHSYRGGKAGIPGFLEDYALMADGLFALYQADFNEEWLNKSEELIGYCFDHFYDPQTGFFSFTSSSHSDSQYKKVEIIDGVIPSSNSVMANTLFRHSRLLDHPEWEETALKMLAKMEEQVLANGSMFAHWARLLVHQIQPFYEVAVTGEEAHEKARQLQAIYLPQVVFAAAKSKSSLPIFESRLSKEDTRIFVCQKKSCRLPVDTVPEALALIK